MPQVSMLTTEQLLLPSGQWFVFVRDIMDTMSKDIADWLDAWQSYELSRRAVHDDYRARERLAHYHAWFEAMAKSDEV